MSLSENEIRERLQMDAFPLSSKYDAGWVLEHEMGPNVLWLTEWLCGAMQLKPGLRVLDMGCGKALSSIFLAKEFGVQVWANDLWIPAAENGERVREAGVEDRVFPIHAEAHALPYATDFFDAILSMDSYHYYGSDDMYLNYITSFLKRGGQLGIAVPALMREFSSGVPEHFSRRTPEGERFWNPADCYSIHTLPWWHEHWRKTELVDIEVADSLENGWLDWLKFGEVAIEAGRERWRVEIDTLREDRGEYLGFSRLVARRR